MERLRIKVRGETVNDTASIESDGWDIHLCARGKRLQVSEGEIYDMITLFMCQFYEDFRGNDDS